MYGTGALGQSEDRVFSVPELRDWMGAACLYADHEAGGDLTPAEMQGLAYFSSCQRDRFQGDFDWSRTVDGVHVEGALVDALWDSDCYSTCSKEAAKVARAEERFQSGANEELIAGAAAVGIVGLLFWLSRRKKG